MKAVVLLRDKVTKRQFALLFRGVSPYSFRQVPPVFYAR